MLWLYHNISTDKQHSQYIHQKADLLFLCLSGYKVDDHVGDNAKGDSFGDTVHKRHCDNTDECRDRFCEVLKIDLRDGCQHQEAYNDQRRCRCKGRNSQKDR